MEIQKLYDLRELTGFVSGEGLHKMFYRLMGHPAPSGNGEIDPSLLETDPIGKQALDLLNAPLISSIDDIVEYTS